MAFERKNLSVLAYANGFTLWHYTTTDLIYDISVNGYFNEMAGSMRKGDMVLCNVDTGGFFGNAIAAVASSDGTTVDLEDAFEFGGINVD